LTETALPPRSVSHDLLRRMREIRQFEERIIKIYPTDAMVTPVHLHIGQEAVPVGVCAHLTDEDKIFFGHRTHGPALAKGLSMKSLMAELYGRTTGCARGYGGSMHLLDPDKGMLGSSSIVGGSIALGVGSALASKLKGQSWIAVSYFGDGAVDSGVFWESLNLSALKHVPVLFVLEDNALSNVMLKKNHIFIEVERVAKEFMPVFQADGTDALSVYDAAGSAIAHIRKTRGPAFLKCPTKRWMKHQGVDADDLPENPVDREADCPIKKLEGVMLDAGLMTADESAAMVEAIDAEIQAAVTFAEQSPFPDPAELAREV
jgi:TPP-dependent pyruvate/acetoin dehydrogenase alpha subunit